MIIKESKTVDSYEAVLKLRDVIRLDTLKMLQHMGYGHIGGSMSIVELLAVLYGKQMRIDNKNPDWGERDRLVLSKGHAGPALYATLANKGFFPHDWLFTLNEGGTNLPSHPDRLKIPGVDATTGSLGQGTSIAAGIATGHWRQTKPVGPTAHRIGKRTGSSGKSLSRPSLQGRAEKWRSIRRTDPQYPAYR